MRAGRPRPGSRSRRSAGVLHGAAGWALIAVLGLLLAGCAAGTPDGTIPQNVLDPAGPVARQQDRLWDLVFPIAVVVFFVVQLGLIFVMVRFRARPDDDGSIPKQVHGNTRLEILWTVIPAVILAGVSVPMVQTIFDLAKVPEDALQVRVVGKQFWWEFQYTGAEGLGVVTANELHIPANRPVYLEMEALSSAIPDMVDPLVLDRDAQAPAALNGVIHSFWVPRLAGKQDVVPGHVRTLTIEADEPGTYSGQCAEFCGLAHAEMRFFVIAHEPADFEAWLQEQAEPANIAGLSGLAAQGAEEFETAQCIACHAIEGYETAGGAAANIKIGPDLTHFASRRSFAGGLFDNADAEEIAAWLRDPQAVKQGAQMPDLGLSEDQIAALVAFLQSLE